MIKITFALIAIGGAGYSILRYTEMPPILRDLAYIIAVMSIVIALPDTIAAAQKMEKEYKIISTLQKTFEPAPCIALAFRADGSAVWNYGKGCSMQAARNACHGCDGWRLSYETIAVAQCSVNSQQYAVSESGRNANWAEHNALQRLYNAGWSNCSIVVVIDPIRGRMK